MFITLHDTARSKDKEIKKKTLHENVIDSLEKNDDSFTDFDASKLSRSEKKEKEDGDLNLSDR
jgi:hypothetical protein